MLFRGLHGERRSTLGTAPYLPIGTYRSRRQSASGPVEFTNGITPITARPNVVSKQRARRQERHAMCVWCTAATAFLLMAPARLAAVGAWLWTECLVENGRCFDLDQQVRFAEGDDADQGHWAKEVDVEVSDCPADTFAESRHHLG